MAYEYGTLKVSIDEGVAFATIHSPPINIMDPEMFNDLDQFTAEVEVDDDVKAVVMQSADPDFFIAHYDLNTLLQVDISQEPKLQSELHPFHVMCERMRTMPKATIAKIAGRVGGGGSEFASSFDMRYGVIGKTQVCQMEVGLGILPGGSGTQRIPRLVGRGRALEIILGSASIDAETLSNWGYLNRIFEADEIDGFVDNLARRIASFPTTAIALAKQSVINSELPLQEGLLQESLLFDQTMVTDEAQARMKMALELGAQTREKEMEIDQLCLDLGQVLRNEE
ncbi:MAG: enoyl-CoA hydratase/isomerase family protein [Gammaproteobacteria bacterium]|jgi:enoyl-CoA hydratase/carnithine racemase|nr:enoyl-CoA hydratase/isomerase family protein [Gammaproteobacteria bacterium]MBT4492776.1 enoyl-CoA hydratase/isomerase family protein [Gammaproteobacteria bacterium]MBT7370363.1 enoyl-CoA hydratase/isomerase family protein [Gammaproteobacteria bacterium]